MNARTLLNEPLGTQVHLLGVGGVGMAGLAFQLHEFGFKVSGCDLMENQHTQWLQEEGLEITCPHDPLHCSSAVQWVIKSTAIPDSLNELNAARAKQIPILRRGEVLATLIEKKQAIAITGTHGKSTTSALVTHVLQACGLDPYYCIGAEVGREGRVAGQGKDPVIVVEADESDGTAAHYHPSIGVLTNIEFDHMEHFADEEQFYKVFEAFAKNTRDHLIFCGDDERALKACSRHPQALSYGCSELCQLRATDLQLEPTQSKFSVQVGDTQLGVCNLSIPGKHNVLNALAACAVGWAIELDMKKLLESLSYATLPKRRFETVVRRNGIHIISDYAHHPTEIRAVVDTAKKFTHKRLLALFQPHRYSRTKALGEAFPAAFRGVDEVVLTPVYAASEQPLQKATSLDLKEFFLRQGMKNSVYIPSLEEAWSYMERELTTGDLLLILGAGDIDKIVPWARAYGCAVLAEERVF